MVRQNNDWQLIPWDGNPELNLQCWRKRFGRGHVSIGVGEFNLIVYSYGANSDESLSSSRGTMSEDEAKALVDSHGGKWGKR